MVMTNSLLLQLAAVKHGTFAHLRHLQCAQTEKYQYRCRYAVLFSFYSTQKTIRSQ